MTSCWDRPAASFAATGRSFQFGAGAAIGGGLADGAGVGVSRASMASCSDDAAIVGLGEAPPPSPVARPKLPDEQATNAPASARPRTRLRSNPPSAKLIETTCDKSLARGPSGKGPEPNVLPSKTPSSIHLHRAAT